MPGGSNGDWPDNGRWICTDGNAASGDLFLRPGGNPVRFKTSYDDMRPLLYLWVDGCAGGKPAWTGLCRNAHAGISYWCLRPAGGLDYDGISVAPFFGNAVSCLPGYLVCNGYGTFMLIPNNKEAISENGSGIGNGIGSPFGLPIPFPIPDPF